MALASLPRRQKQQLKPMGFLGPRSRPLLYVNMPKSGCTTIKNVLHRLDAGTFLEDPLTIHGRKDLLVRPGPDREKIIERLKTDVVFTFVRHPLRRAYSCFNEKIHFRSPYSFGKVRHTIETEYGARFEETPSIETHRHNFGCFLKFSRDSFQGRNGWRRDPHWCPQSMVVRNATAWRMIDFIGRVEEFERHLGVVLGLAGIAYDFEVPRMNEGAPPPYRYDEIMTDELRSLGVDLFAGDLKNFGYSV